MSRISDWEKMWQEAIAHGLVYDDESGSPSDMVNFDAYPTMEPTPVEASDYYKQRWCNHDWKVIDLGNGRAVYNCKHCDMKKEDWDAEQAEKKRNNNEWFD